MRILVADDHEVVRRGVISLLLARADCEVCGEAKDGQEAVEKASALKPDVAILDVSMPVLNGLDATRAIRSILPSCEILVLSQHDAPEMARQAFKAGALGYVIKSSLGKHLFDALDKLARHESFFDPGIADLGGPVDVREILQRSAALEQALRESEQLYRTTFELAAVGIAHVRPDGQWLRVNHRLCEIVGYSESELLQMTFQEITHPDDLAADLALTEKLRSGELQKFSMEKRYVRKDGSHVWVNLTVSGARDTSGRTKHLIALIEDITERRRAEEAQARLAAIVASSDDAIISKDLNGIINSWNAGASRIFEYSPEETVGRSIMLLIPPELREEENGILRRLQRGERIDHFETVRLAKSGRRINVSLTISPVRDGKGRVVGASKIARDVTERKRFEEALRESQAKLSLALESSRTGIFDWDIVEQRGNWNEQLAAIYDFHPAGPYIFRDEWRSLLHPEDAPRLDEEASRVSDRDKFEFEYRTIRPDGEIRWILSRGRIVKDANGKPLRMIGTHTDITDRKQAEEVAKVREFSGKLLNAQDSERRRIARELHDSAGQLVAALQMQLTPMQESTKLTPELATGVRESLELLQQLSRELRTVSHLLHPPLLDELGLTSALRWYVEGFSERSKIDVNLDFGPDLGRLPSEMETALFRIVQECLTNIHRHSGSNKACIRVHRHGDEMYLQVQDFGKGIATNKRASGFRFGVGIQGMQERVRQLNGLFEIQTQTSGTSILVRLPLTDASVLPGQLVQSAS